MTDLKLSQTRIREGIWEGILTDPAAETEVPPALLATHLEAPIDGMVINPVPGSVGTWSVHLPIPAAALSDGVQTILIIEPTTDTTLCSFVIIAGEPLEEDIRAEVDLLRAELDMLKRAFRRHCLDTS